MGTTFGDALREARRIMKMTQKELAEYLGKTNSTICDWEKGRSSPSPEDVEQICRVLNISPAQLLGGRSSELTLQESQLLQFFRLMSAKDKETILALAERMVDA